MLDEIKNMQPGKIFFSEDFLDMADKKNINKALERLHEKKKIRRIARGVYVRPKTDNVIGELIPTLDEIAQAIAQRDKARIIPTGSYALYKIGLTSQIPMNTVYLTDGAPRKIKVRSKNISFKKTTPRNLTYKGERSALAIQAIKTIGKENITEEEKKIITEYLTNEIKENILHDLKLAPEWVRRVLKGLIDHVIE